MERTILVAALLCSAGASASTARADAVIWLASDLALRDPNSGKECFDHISDTIVVDDPPTFQRKYTSECGSYRAVIVLDGTLKADGSFELMTRTFADHHTCVFSCGWHICSGGENRQYYTYTKDGDRESEGEAYTFMDLDEDWDVVHTETRFEVSVD
jgi:hypothetical protein